MKFLVLRIVAYLGAFLGGLFDEPLDVQPPPDLVSLAFLSTYCFACGPMIYLLAKANSSKPMKYSPPTWTANPFDYKEFFIPFNFLASSVFSYGVGIVMRGVWRPEDILNGVFFACLGGFLNLGLCAVAMLRNLLDQHTSS